MMAVTTFAIPASLAEALGHMQRPIACPEDVKARIAALRVPADEVSGTRMPTNWRSGAGGGHRGHSDSRDSRDHRDSRGHSDSRDGRGGGWSQPRPSSGWRQQQPSSAPRRPYPNRANMPRFGNKARKDAATEARMMDLIRKKMNLFSEMTYDATKSWLSELLDSGETDFLTGFITLVFEKAAREPAITSLYAQLLTELRASFPHVGVELTNIFGNFLNIFEEAAHEPDVGTEEYAAFLQLRNHRQYRRGYASFIGDIAKQGALTADDVIRTSLVILDGLFAARAAADKGLLCEEYADCLTALLTSCEELMRPVIGSILPRVAAAQDRKDAPSLTNKARFALMDITDLYG
jgi:hypothetical protein